MQTVTLTIDGKKITVPEGEKILWAALDNDIYIPHLCGFRDGEKPSASCRLCFVEIEGYEKPVTSCTETVREGMVVNTKGEEALRLARAGFELLMASHPVECATCPANGSCELQNLAKYLHVSLKTRRLKKLLREYPIDDSHPEIVLDRNKCVLCGQCVAVCRQRLGIGALGFAHRGFRRIITTFGDEAIAKHGCEGCGDCIRACPVGALSFKEMQKN